MILKEDALKVRKTRMFALVAAASLTSRVGDDDAADWQALNTRMSSVGHWGSVGRMSEEYLFRDTRIFMAQLGLGQLPIKRRPIMIDTKAAPYAILALRVTTGALFLFHGLMKLFVFTPAGPAGYFKNFGLPGALGYLPMLVEIAGGVALLLGVWTRNVPAALVPGTTDARIHAFARATDLRRSLPGTARIAGDR